MSDARTLAPQPVTATRIGVGMTPFQELPHYARIALDWLRCDESKREAETLDRLLKHFAAHTVGCEVDDEVRASAHRIASERFWNFEPHPNA